MPELTLHFNFRHTQYSATQHRKVNDKTLKSGMAVCYICVKVKVNHEGQAQGGLIDR